ncbi:MAG TPA: hypothetical protein VD978_18410 [Azospirillum sp.]|nr:hypothetical protein [Azospirillum sp.]
MLSFSKLLLLVLVIGAVWFGWRWFQRVDAVRREQVRRQAAPPPASPRRDTYAEPARGPSAEDMEKCPECGAYVAPRSAVSCGRPGCPYGR